VKGRLRKQTVHWLCILFVQTWHRWQF